jgi:hypothetical protein
VMDITSQSGSMAVKASPSVGLRAGHWLRDGLDGDRVRASVVLVLDGSESGAGPDRVPADDSISCDPAAGPLATALLVLLLSSGRRRERSSGSVDAYCPKRKRSGAGGPGESSLACRPRTTLTAGLPREPTCSGRRPLGTRPRAVASFEPLVWDVRKPEYGLWLGFPASWPSPQFGADPDEKGTHGLRLS